MGLKKLAPRHELLAMALAGGMPQKLAAERFGLTPVRVSGLYNDPLFRTRMTELQKEWQRGTREQVIQKFEEEAMGSVETLVELREDRDVDASVRRNAARDLLFDGYFGQREKAREKEIAESEKGGNTFNIAMGTELTRRIVQALGEVGETVVLPQLARAQLADLRDAEIVASTVDADDGSIRWTSPEEFRGKWADREWEEDDDEE